MGSCEGENHSQISCWAHMVISTFGYACKCLIQHQGGVTKDWGNKWTDIAALLKTFSLPPLRLSSSERWDSCTQSFRSNFCNRDFSSPEASFQKVPLLLSGQPLWCGSRKWCCGNSCSRAQLHPSPYQKLRQKLILLLFPHPISSHSCEWQGLGYVYYAELHLHSSLLFGEGLANTVSLWSRNFHTGSLIPHKAAVNDDSSISLSSVNGCLDI